MSETFSRSVVFSGTPISSTNKTDRHDITEILLKVALNTIASILKFENPPWKKTFLKKIKIRLMFQTYNTLGIVTKNMDYEDFNLDV